MDRMLIKNLYNLEETIAASFFDGAQYPWELLGEIGEYIVKLGNSLDPEKYEKRAENVWVARNAKVFGSAYLGGPCIIDEEAEEEES